MEKDILPGFKAKIKTWAIGEQKMFAYAWITHEFLQWHFLLMQ